MPVAEGFFTVGGIPSSTPQYFQDLGSANFFLDGDNQDTFLSDIRTTTDDTDLFKYFLNEELQPDSSPPSSSSVGSAEGSPSASPPHLANHFSDGIPDSPSSIEPFSSPIIPNHPNSPLIHSVDAQVLDPRIKIKEEKALPKGNANSSTNTPSGSPVKENSRKRSAPSNNTQKEPTSPVGLSREELLKLSSKSLDNAATNISSQRTLSHDEERQLKRQRRLIKNRESAQLSRLRKKMYIEELEKKVNQLSAENDALTKQVATIAADKDKIQEEVAYLQSIIRQSPQLSQIASSANSKKTNIKNVKAAGICLLVVLFSFGVLFNSAPNLLNGDKNDKGKQLFNTGRLLKSITEETMPLIPVPSENNQLIVLEDVDTPEDVIDTKYQFSNPKKHPREDHVEKLLIGEPTIEVKSESSLNKKRKMKISEENDSEVVSKSVELVPLSNENQIVTTERLPSRLPSSNAELVIKSTGLADSNPRANTAYIYCSEAQQVQPVGVTQTPENIALLIPASVLNATQGAQFDTSLLEVQCQVLNLHVWPMQNASAQRP